MISIIAIDNMFGHYAKALVQSASTDMVTATFLRKLNYEELAQHIDEEATLVMILGLPYYKSQHTGLEESLQALGFNDNLPFSEVVHIANWGDTMEIKDVISKVDEGPAITTMLKDYMQEGMMGVKEFNVGAKRMVEHLEAYHTYNFKEFPTSAPLSLKLLSDVYRGKIAEAIELTPKGMVFDGDLRDSLYRNMNTYIMDKLDKVEVDVVFGNVVALVYAEEYHNELARRIIEGYSDAGYDKVIVLIGRQTRGDDMFHVRVTTDTLHANMVAKLINNGKGNEHAATVFLGKPREHLMSAIKTQLQSKL